MKFQIKKWHNFEVIFETEAETLKQAAELAVERGANLRDSNLRDSNLRGADLRGADLRGADLIGADLIGANLRGANLRDSNLRDSNLRGANLRGADLRGANLRDSNLRDSNLRGANLRGADLIGADLIGANLRGADWSDVKKDMFEKMALMPNEVPYLYKSLVDGKINGSAYEGECACFCGTLANAKGVKYDAIEVKPDSSSPTEIFFTQIQTGDTPENNQFSKLAVDWVKEFCKEKEIKLPTRKVIWA